MKKRLLGSFIFIAIAGILLTANVCLALSTEIYLTSDPSGAEVYLDGKKIGVTPLTVTVKGVAKDHTIELRRQDCKSVVKTIYNTYPVCVPGCYPAVTTEMGSDEELLEDRRLHVALQRK